MIWVHSWQPCLWWVAQELFAVFGPISRIYIAYDRETGESRGFAFVNFVYRCAPPLTRLSASGLS